MHHGYGGGRGGFQEKVTQPQDLGRADSTLGLWCWWPGWDSPQDLRSSPAMNDTGARSLSSSSPTGHA